MTRDQLLTMSGLPGADVGAHTLTHVQLRGQPAGLKRREIVGSVEVLRSLTGRPVTSFAYPFGSPRAVDPEAQRFVREAECTLACSTNPGLAVLEPTATSCRGWRSRTGRETSLPSELRMRSKTDHGRMRRRLRGADRTSTASCAHSGRSSPERRSRQAKPIAASRPRHARFNALTDGRKSPRGNRYKNANSPGSLREPTARA